MSQPPVTTAAAEYPVDSKFDYDNEKDISSTTASSVVVGSDTDLVNKYYEPPDSYESKHRWDPKAEWTAKEERRLVRRLDWKVAAAACLCFAALNLDRSNIGNALSDNMLDDLGITTGDYNIGQTLFYTCFLAAELPSQMSKPTDVFQLTSVSKKLGSDVWIPIQMMGWSVVAITQCAMHNKAGFFVTRALVGLIEGGFIADTILYLSYYYTSNELTVRLSFFWVTMTVTQIIGSLLAAGILQLRHTTGYAGWRWLFALEGGLTFLIGAWAMWYLPPGPTQTHTKWRRKGWFTEREEVILVNRVLRDDPTKSSMHNREGLGLRDLWLSLTDFDLWPLYLIGLVGYIVPATLQSYLTLVLRSLGFSTFQTNLLTIPYCVLFIIMNLSVVFLSRALKERILTATLAQFWLLICLIALVLIPDATPKWAKWALLTVTLAYPYPHPILVSTNSMNSGSVRTRTVASSMYNIFVQAATLVGQNIYQPSDAPFYHKGNRVLLGITAAAIIVSWFAKGWFVWRNRQRAAIWDSWTLEEKEEYLRTTKDEGNKRLDFRFQH